MSSALYEVLALSARYLFALLGVLIVLHTLFALLSDRSARARRLRGLPYAGMIGEFIVIAGDQHLQQGTVISIPWEGILGAVRSSDVDVPCEGVHRRHLSFRYVPGTGLLLHPFSGCEAMINGTVIDCRVRPEALPMVQGSFLQVGQAVLRLHLYGAPDPSMSFDAVQTAPAPSVSFEAVQAAQDPSAGFEAVLAVPDPSAGFDAVQAVPDPSAGFEAVQAAPAVSPAPRRRRSDRWEVDWSE